MKPARRLASSLTTECPTRWATGLSTLALLLCVVGAPQARAGMFDDEEARRQIKDLSIHHNERLDTLSKGQIDLANQIQALREDNAKLHGLLETLTYELDAAKKRQQDFYIDLDGRLRKIETPQGAGAAAEEGKPAEVAGEPAKKTASDPAAETRDYEAALNLFRTDKIKDAATAFDAFVKAHPDSTLAPNAQYWLGNAYYALHDCKKAIDAHRVVVARWAQNPKAPDSLVNIATCQQELGDAKGAKTSLEAVIAKYPDSSAAATAKKRLNKK